MWHLEKLARRLVDMRDAYSRWSNESLQKCEHETSEESESHSLIGIGNFYVNVLFSDCWFAYSVPLVDQQGQYAGNLNVELKKDGIVFENNTNATSTCSSGSNVVDQGTKFIGFTVIGRDPIDYNFNYLTFAV